ncbi:MAG: PAS domain-containing protein [Pseudomonadota bacterium]
MLNADILIKAVQASNDGIVISEQEGDDHILIYVNPAFERLTGYGADEILYQDCRFLQSGDRDQPGIAIIRDALAKGEAVRAVVRNYRKDGTLFWNELSITPVYDDDAELTYYIGIQKDVTRQVELEAENARLREELATLRAERAPV